MNGGTTPDDPGAPDWLDPTLAVADAEGEELKTGEPDSIVIV